MHHLINSFKNHLEKRRSRQSKLLLIYRPRRDGRLSSIQFNLIQFKPSMLTTKVTSGKKLSQCRECVFKQKCFQLLSVAESVLYLLRLYNAWQQCPWNDKIPRTEDETSGCILQMFSYGVLQRYSPHVTVGDGNLFQSMVTGSV